MGEISITMIFVGFVLVFCQSWRSVWKRKSFTSPCVISSFGTVSASRWSMCPTSPTSPIRMPPTRDSCKPPGQVLCFLCWNISFCWQLGNPGKTPAGSFPLSENNTHRISSSEWDFQLLKTSVNVCIISVCLCIQNRFFLQERESRFQADCG